MSEHEEWVREHLEALIGARRYAGESDLGDTWLLTVWRSQASREDFVRHWTALTKPEKASIAAWLVTEKIQRSRVVSDFMSLAKACKNLDPSTDVAGLWLGAVNGLNDPAAVQRAPTAPIRGIFPAGPCPSNTWVRTVHAFLLLSKHPVREEQIRLLDCAPDTDCRQALERACTACENCLSIFHLLPIYCVAAFFRPASFGASLREFRTLLAFSFWARKLLRRSEILVYIEDLDGPLIGPSIFLATFLALLQTLLGSYPGSAPWFFQQIIEGLDARGGQLAVSSDGNEFGMLKSVGETGKPASAAMAGITSLFFGPEESPSPQHTAPLSIIRYVHVWGVLFQLGGLWNVTWAEERLHRVRKWEAVLGLMLAIIIAMAIATFVYVAIQPLLWPGGPVVRSPIVWGPPQVSITQVPHAGPSGADLWADIAISGRTYNVNPSDYWVVIYLKDPANLQDPFDDVWYVQPCDRVTQDYPNGPFTSINPDGTWSTKTRQGVEYAAILLRKSKPVERMPNPLAVMQWPVPFAHPDVHAYYVVLGRPKSEKPTNKH